MEVENSANATNIKEKDALLVDDPKINDKAEPVKEVKVLIENDTLNSKPSEAIEKKDTPITTEASKDDLLSKIDEAVKDKPELSQRSEEDISNSSADDFLKKIDEIDGEAEAAKKETAENPEVAEKREEKESSNGELSAEASSTEEVTESEEKEVFKPSIVEEISSDSVTIVELDDEPKKVESVAEEATPSQLPVDQAMSVDNSEGSNDDVMEVDGDGEQMEVVEEKPSAPTESIDVDLDEPQEISSTEDVEIKDVEIKSSTNDVEIKEVIDSDSNDVEIIENDDKKPPEPIIEEPKEEVSSESSSVEEVIVNAKEETISKTKASEVESTAEVESSDKSVDKTLKSIPSIEVKSPTPEPVKSAIAVLENKSESTVEAVEKEAVASEESCLDSTDDVTTIPVKDVVSVVTQIQSETNISSTTPNPPSEEPITAKADEKKTDEPTPVVEEESKKLNGMVSDATTSTSLDEENVKVNQSTSTFSIDIDGSSTTSSSVEIKQPVFTYDVQISCTDNELKFLSIEANVVSGIEKSNGSLDDDVSSSLPKEKHSFASLPELCDFMINQFTRIKKTICPELASTVQLTPKGRKPKISSADTASTPSSTSKKRAGKRAHDDDVESTPKAKQIKKESSVTPSKELVDSNPDFKKVRVLAKWVDKKYYAGRVQCEKPNSKFIVLFEDGATKTLPKESIVFADSENDILPLKGHEIHALVTEDEYESGVVEDIKLVNGKPMYHVKCDNETVRVTAMQMYLQEDQAKMILKDVDGVVGSESSTGTPSGRGSRNKRAADVASPNTPEAGVSGVAAGKRGNKRQKRYS